ncbi:unnamed protein product [Bursaphelenchus okinawaensis]|uniref:G-protein coupled receptors family 1 profile domain-containing protein n=1 Tax=Bursaphelenchus okinawaensis TaxID=465554 RepID=A0A811KWX9_9BILA|nr:unnamed protein product [Bursaphelenchus okinawaensis]CAG9112482.1 unnamed protein product [Bursaphelenchus okinawaensis]
MESDVRDCLSDCSCHQNYQFYEYDERFILGVVAWGVIVFGIICNLTSVRIFTHRLMYSTCINWYLTVLSVTDSLVLASAFFVLTLPRLGETFQFWIATRISYKMVPVCYGLMTFAQTASVWITVALSVHRFVGVCYPFRSMDWLSEQKVRRLIVSIIMFAALFNVTRFFEVRVVNNCFRKNIGTLIPVIAPTALRMNPIYRLVFFGWAYTLVMFLLPFVTLIIVNSRVLHSIRRQNRLHRRESTTPAEKQMTKKAEIKERQTTIMLFALVAVFLSCNTLALLSNIMENLGYDDTSAYATLVTFNNFFILAKKKISIPIRLTDYCFAFQVIVNASSNVFIFLLFSEKYRLIMKTYMGLYRRPSRTESQLLTNGPIFL